MLWYASCPLTTFTYPKDQYRCLLYHGVCTRHLQICITDTFSIILKSAQNKISSDMVMVLVVKCHKCMYSAFVVVGCVVTCSCTAQGRDSVVQQWWWWGDRSSLQHCVSCTALRSTVLGCTVQYHNNSTHSTIFFQIHITLYFAMFRPSFKFTDFLSLSFLEAIL